MNIVLWCDKTLFDGCMVDLVGSFVFDYRQYGSHQLMRYFDNDRLWFFSHMSSIVSLHLRVAP